MARKSDELWQEALDSLPQELQRVLTLHPPPQTDRRLLLDTVVREARQQRQICLQKRWKITRRDGSVIIVRDVFEKIVRWVEEFKGIGNEALRFAPSYAMIPWGIVCMLVKVSPGHLTPLPLQGATGHGLHVLIERGLTFSRCPSMTMKCSLP